MAESQSPTTHDPSQDQPEAHPADDSVGVRAPKKKAKKKTKAAKVPAEKKVKKKRVKQDEQKQGALPTGKLALRKHPQLYSRDVRPPVRPHVRIAGLDLASSTGVSFADIVPGHPVGGAKITMGQWHLGMMGDYDTGPLRMVRLREFLTILSPDLVLLEDARFNIPAGVAQGMSMTAIVSRAVSGAEFLGALKTTVATWCEEHGVPCQGIPSTVLKKFATGKGVADKKAMVAAANARFDTNFDPETFENTGVDNIADSAFLCQMGCMLYSDGLTAADLEHVAAELPATRDAPDNQTDVAATEPSSEQQA